MVVSPPPQKKVPSKHRSWKIFGIVTGSIILLVVAFFFTLVIQAARNIRSAQNVAKLSNEKNFTQNGQNTNTATTVDRAVVETNDDPSLGPADAKVVIVEFGDFECPFCQQSVSVVKKILDKYGTKVKFIFRDFPNISIHPDALAAAEAAGCANDQGKFWAYHDLLYLNQNSLSTASLTQYAAQARLNVGTFSSCLSSQQHDAEIEQDFTAGQELGVSGTPTWFFNGHRVEGAIPYKTFEKIVKYGLAGKL